MPITDEYMKRMMIETKEYTIVILTAAQKRNELETEKIIWEHGRRNFSLREEGKLSIVCPINDETEVKGVGIFTTSVEETRRIMDEDPGVKAGIFTYEVHPCRSFPGDTLPEKIENLERRHSEALWFTFSCGGSESKLKLRFYAANFPSDTRQSL